MLIRSMGPVSELDMVRLIVLNLNAFWFGLLRDIISLFQDYSMDCYFRQYWRDTRLKFQGPMKSLSLSIKVNIDVYFIRKFSYIWSLLQMLERIWRPDTYFYNGKQSHIHTITVPNKLLRLTQDGDILYSMR